MQICFKKTFVDAHASCFGKHNIDWYQCLMNPYQPLAFHILSYANIPVQNFNLCWLKHHLIREHKKIKYLKEMIN